MREILCFLASMNGASQGSKLNAGNSMSNIVATVIDLPKEVCMLYIQQFTTCQEES